MSMRFVPVNDVHAAVLQVVTSGSYCCGPITFQKAMTGTEPFIAIETQRPSSKNVYGGKDVCEHAFEPLKPWKFRTGVRLTHEIPSCTARASPQAGKLCAPAIPDALLAV